MSLASCWLLYPAAPLPGFEPGQRPSEGRACVQQDRGKRETRPGIEPGRAVLQTAHPPENLVTRPGGHPGLAPSPGFEPGSSSFADSCLLPAAKGGEKEIVTERTRWWAGLAGAEGIEPPFSELETDVLPLDDAPLCYLTAPPAGFEPACEPLRTRRPFLWATGAWSEQPGSNRHLRYGKPLSSPLDNARRPEPSAGVEPA